MHTHASWPAFLEHFDVQPRPKRLVAYSKFALTHYAVDGTYQPGDYLLFGAETHGLPDTVRGRSCILLGLWTAAQSDPLSMYRCHHGVRLCTRASEANVFSLLHLHKECKHCPLDTPSRLQCFTACARDSCTSHHMDNMCRQCKTLPTGVAAWSRSQWTRRTCGRSTWLRALASAFSK
jgi:hypothetical protein